MSNTVRKLFALILALTFLFTCALAEGDKVVATYNGGEVTLAEVENMIESESNMLVSSFSYFTGGAPYTLTEEDLANIRKSVITAQAKFEILLSKMAELGVSDFTEEEKSVLRQNAEYYYLENVYAFMQQGMSADEAAYYLNSQGITPDSLYDNTYRNAVMSKIAGALSIDENVTEEDISSQYETLTSNYEKNYASSPASVESAANAGDIVYFMPENMRYVKHIILIPEDEALVSEFENAANKLTAYETEYAQITSPSYQARYDAIVEKAIKEECLENIAIWEENLKSLQDKYLEAVKPAADEILLALENGESFDALIETYSKDSGSMQEPVKTNGYLVYENSVIWDKAFIETAKALENVGDVSEPVCGTLGVYIVKYESQPESGKAALENVKDAVVASVLSARRSDAFSAQTETWYNEANIQVNLEAFN